MGSGTITMSGGSITTAATGANGIVAYGGTVNVSNVTITTTSSLSRGIHATGGGSITASNLTISTSSSNCSVIALDRGGGTVTVTGGSYKTTGSDSAVMYSTGTLSVSGITGSSGSGEIGVVEGSNSISIADSAISSGILMEVDYNTGWSTNGATGNLTLSGSGSNYAGSIVADSYSTATVTVESDTTWTGAFDTADTAKSTSLTISGGVWDLSADSYVDSITLEEGAVINCEGHTLSYGTLTQTSGTINN